MRTPSSMISVVLAVVALMVFGMIAATFGGLWMIERVLADPADAVPSVLSSILLMVIPLLLITVAGVAACIWVFRRFRRGNDALLRTGIAARLSVLLRDTGTTSTACMPSSSSACSSPSRPAPYQARAETMVARMNWGSVQPGMQLSVRVDPPTPRASPSTERRRRCAVAGGDDRRGHGDSGRAAGISGCRRAIGRRSSREASPPTPSSNR